MSGLDTSARGISPAAATVTPDKQDYESDAEASPVVFIPGSGRCGSVRFRQQRSCWSGDVQKSPSDFPDSFFFVLVFSQIDHLLMPKNPGNTLGIQDFRIARNDRYQTTAKTRFAKCIPNVPAHLPAHPFGTHRIRCQEYDHRLGFLQRVTHLLSPIIARHDLLRGIPSLQASFLEHLGNLAGKPFIRMCVADEYLHYFLPSGRLDPDSRRAATVLADQAGKKTRADLGYLGYLAGGNSATGAGRRGQSAAVPARRRN